MTDPARHYASVYRYVRRRTRTREDAEDLTQAVFAVLERAASESPPTLAWLYTVAKRRLIDEHRRRHGEPAQVISLDAAKLELPARDNYGTDVAGALARAIAALPDDQRRVVVLKVIEGRRFAEIAVRLHCTEEACRARLSRALRTLRAQLADEGIAP